jgi:hypothetical protein
MEALVATSTSTRAGPEVASTLSTELTDPPLASARPARANPSDKSRGIRLRNCERTARRASGLV